MHHSHWSCLDASPYHGPATEAFSEKSRKTPRKVYSQCLVLKSSLPCHAQLFSRCVASTAHSTPSFCQPWPLLLSTRPRAGTPRSTTSTMTTVCPPLGHSEAWRLTLAQPTLRTPTSAGALPWPRSTRLRLAGTMCVLLSSQVSASSPMHMISSPSTWPLPCWV